MFWQIIDGDTLSTSWPSSSVFKISDMESTEPWFLTSELVLSFILSPLVSFIGVTGNILTGIVLIRRRGQHRCSDVLILALAVADTMYLLGTNNVPLRMYLRGEEQPGFYHTEIVSKICYVFFHAHAILESFGKITSMILPTVLTLERFIAVFFPFHFSRILTVRRMRITVVVVFLLSVPEIIIFSSLSKFSYEFDPGLNTSVGRILKSDTFSLLRPYDLIATRIYFILLGPVSISFVVIGCCMIGVKIQLQTRRLKNIISTPVGLTTRQLIEERYGLRSIMSACICSVLCSAFCKTNKSNERSDSDGKISNASSDTSHFGEIYYLCCELNHHSFCDPINYQCPEIHNHQCHEIYNHQIHEINKHQCHEISNHQSHEIINHQCDKQQIDKTVFNNDKSILLTGSEINSQKIPSLTLSFKDHIEETDKYLGQDRTLDISRPDFNLIREMSTSKQRNIPVREDSDLYKCKTFKPEEKRQETISTSSLTSIAKTSVKNANRSCLRSSRPRGRTTLSLLSICVVYSITCGFNFITIYFFNDEHFDFVTCLVMERAGKLALCVNSACNFFIYVVLNRNFRENFKENFCPCFRNK